jgi:hypothetical protein
VLSLNVVKNLYVAVLLVFLCVQTSNLSSIADGSCPYMMWSKARGKGTLVGAWQEYIGWCEARGEG